MSLTTGCRVCLKESLEDFFEMNEPCYFSQDDLSFGEVFNFCTHLMVGKNDKLPQRICILCVQDLQQTYEFLNKVFASDKKLNKLLECSKQEICNLKSVNYAKDPLENVTEKEIKDKKLIELVHNDRSSFTSLDNSDIFENLHSNSDDDSSNFLKSIESQIFPQGSLRCKICYKAYFTNVGLQAHMDMHLPKSNSTYEECCTKTLLDRTYTRDKEVIDISISDCNKKEDNVSKITTKQKGRRFSCQVCGRIIVTPSKLRCHMLTHTGEKDFLCTMCSKAYPTVYALKYHMRTHTGERPYKCKYCGDRFTRPATLKGHMRRHTGERPYVCDFCGKRFVQHSSMTTHIKTNHMDKAFPCSYCVKKYARQIDLKRHLQSHTGEKPFACQLCPRRFTRRSNLNQHLNKIHGNENLEEEKINKTSLEETTSDNFLQDNSEKDLNVVKDNKISNASGHIYEKTLHSSNLKINMNFSSMVLLDNKPSDLDFHQPSAVIYQTFVD